MAVRSALPAVLLLSTWACATGPVRQPPLAPRGINHAIISPSNLSAAPDGSILVSDPGSLRIWRVRGRVLEVVAGSGRGGDSPDGVRAVDARLSGLGDVAEDAAGTIYFVELADSARSRIRRIDRHGVLSTVALPTEKAATDDGGWSEAGYISGLAVDARGNLYYAQRLARCIKKIDGGGTVSTVLDSGLGSPTDIVIDRHGRILAASFAEIVEVDAAGTVVTRAGTGEHGYSGDGGPAVNALFSEVLSLADGGRDDLLVADLLNDSVRRLGSDGRVSTLVAGAARASESPCRLCLTDVAVDGNGTIYLATRTGLKRLGRGNRVDALFAASPMMAKQLAPTRTAFLAELLDAEYSLVTRRFDDYTPGSYHVDKLDAYRGLVQASAAAGRVLRGVLIVGGYGPLWTYDVTAFFQETDGVRANQIVMAHARITWKGTALLSEAQFTRTMDELRRSSLASPTPPARTANEGEYPEQAYSVLLVDITTGRPDVGYGRIDLWKNEPATNQFVSVLNSFESLFRTTYGG